MRSFLTLLPALLATAAFAADGSGGTGTILRQVWSDTGGVAITDLVSHEDYPDYPSSSSALQIFEAPADAADSYGARICGYVHPPKSGEYTFWIASDDMGELSLSSSEDPAKKVKIASVPEWTPAREWGKFPQQKSAPVKLEAGKKYYIEALQKEATGGDNLAVGWQLPDGAQERPIPGNRLSPYVPPKLGARVRVPKPPPSQPGHFNMKFEHTIGDKTFKLPYLLYLPPDYVSDKSPKPVLVFLHGVGERGTDLQGVYGWGPDGHILRTPGFKARYPFIGIAPQCAEPWRWEAPEMYKTVVAIIKHVSSTFNADKDRIYLTGLSMGGRGTWETALEAPDLFAAIAPISSIAVRPDEAAQKLKNTATWIICGAQDGGYTTGSKQMYDVMSKATQTQLKFTMHPNRGHDVWTDYYPTEKLYAWFLTRRKGMPAKPEPVVEPPK